MDLKRQPPFWFIFILLCRYIIKRFQRYILGFKKYKNVVIEGKVVVITGANAGLGKMTAIEMAKRGATVVIGCRNLLAGQMAVDEMKILSGSANFVLFELDLANFSSLRKFCKDVLKRFPRIDILINNAGIFDPAEKVEHTENGFEKHFAINHLGHFLLTNLLEPGLKRGAPSRVINIGSTSDFIEELQMTDLNFTKRTGRSSYGILMGRIFGKAYATSKFANALFSYELGRRLCSTGVMTYLVCPGMVEGTNLFRKHGPIDRVICTLVLKIIGIKLEQGIETILYCALSKNCEQETGLYYQFGEPHPYENYRISANQHLAKLLWKESEKLVGIKGGVVGEG